jgi:hypothetical protein
MELVHTSAWHGMLQHIGSSSMQPESFSVRMELNLSFNHMQEFTLGNLSKIGWPSLPTVQEQDDRNQRSE